MGVGNARIPGSTEAMLGLHGCCSQTRKGESEDGTEAADLGACSMVGGGQGALQTEVGAAKMEPMLMRGESRGYFFTSDCDCMPTKAGSVSHLEFPDLGTVLGIFQMPYMVRVSQSTS